MVRDNPPSQDASTHQIWNTYLKEYRRYAPDTKRDGRTDIVITIKTKSEVKVKVTVTRKWYATLGHPKMHPHTKFGIPTLKNIEICTEQSGTDGRMDSAITICLPKFLLGHKKMMLKYIYLSRTLTYTSFCFGTPLSSFSSLCLCFSFLCFFLCLCFFFFFMLLPLYSSLESALLLWGLFLSITLSSSSSGELSTSDGIPL